ncbi:Short-chain dehydrogenase [Nocardioides scoriae]|uniref:Short-chain dehydrogenase n=1 Tax=Nocardioides scoriae TaxID=642780 RepID=A0A1H1MN92_9ACTN|nr:SDR family NAD(P)-dependent oxidoreductase [Nocardioides scoriae]SDR88313.1 Short-chain dehydrogenase [Nocardioides scoriae]
MSTRLEKLRDQVVVVTGAGSGMGREISLLAARHGARLAISDVNAAGLAETVDLLERGGAAEVRSDRVDVSDRQQMVDWAAAVAAQFGTVTMVVNNAGVSYAGDVEEMTYDDLDWILGINFMGVVHGTKEFLPHLIASGNGYVVNVSSLFGLISIPGQSAYNATKFAVRGFTEALREEMIVNRHPVSVTCVHPGGIKTGIARNGRKVAGTDVQATDDFFDQKLAKMTADKAARIILEGALARRPRQLVGLDAHLLHQFGRITGARYQDVVARVAGRMAPGKSIV